MIENEPVTEAWYESTEVLFGAGIGSVLLVSALGLICSVRWINYRLDAGYRREKEEGYLN